MTKKKVNRRNFIKIGLGLSSAICIPGYAKNNGGNKELKIESKSTTEITDINLSVKGEKPKEPILVHGLRLDSIYSEVSFKNCTVELVLNDIPIKRFTNDQIPFETEHSTPYIVKGKNILEVVINPGPTPAQSRIPNNNSFNNDIEIKTRLASYLTDGMIDGKRGITLTSEHWKSKDHKSVKYPFIVSSVAELPDSIPTWAWQKSDDLSLTRDYDGAINFIKELRDAYQSFDSDKFFNLNKIFYTEINDMYPNVENKTMEQYKNDLIQDMDKLKKENDRKFMTINTDNLSLRLCGNNKLIDCIGKDWKPIIRTNVPDDFGQIFCFQVFIGKINGQWSVFRGNKYYERV